MANTYSPTWFESFLQSIPPSQTELEVGFICRYLPQPAYRTVLDLCCGPGRHARLLAEKSYHVTGIDQNAHALVQAKSRSGGQIVYLKWDMRNLRDLPGSFDAAINLWQSFGYFDEATNADVPGQISQKLTSKGRLILDIYHRGFIEQHQGIRTFEKDDRIITESKSMIGNRLTVRLDYGFGETDVFDWQLYTPDEMCGLAEPFGLQGLVICAGFDEKQSASAYSPRMQIVFEKK